MGLQDKKIFISMICGVVLICLILSYVLTPRATYEAHMMAEVYANNEEYDMVFLGPSSTYCAIDTNVLNENKTCFVLGSGSQTPLQAYYLLAEAYKSHRIKKVVLTLNYPVLFANDDMNATLIISDQMKVSKNRNDLILAGTDEASYLFRPYSILTRYHDTIYKEWKTYIMRIITKNRLEGYEGSGFWAFPDGGLNGDLVIPTTDYVSGPWDLEKLECYVNYISRIDELCHKNDSEFLLMSTPMHSDYIEYKATDIQKIHDYFENIANELNVSFLDYNFLRKDVTYFQDEDYCDYVHLDESGARHFTEILTLTMQETANSDCFWNDIMDKIGEME